MGIERMQKNTDDFLNSIIKVARQSGIINGYNRGYDDGFKDGYEKRKIEDMAAISDGLRYGSPECGRALSKM